jgi:hypothetical protein
MKYIQETRAFFSPSIWVSRFFSALGLGIFAVILNGSDVTGEFLIIAGTIILVVFLVAPVRDLGYNQEFVYIIRRSLLPSLSKVIRFKIDQIQTIRIEKETVSNKAYIMNGLVFVTIYFTDNTSEVLQIRADRKKLVGLLRSVNDLVHKNKSMREKRDDSSYVAL